MAILTDGEILDWTTQEERIGDAQSALIANFTLNSPNFDLDELLSLFSSKYESPTHKKYRKFRTYSEWPSSRPKADFHKIYFYYFGIESLGHSIFCRVFSDSLTNPNQIDQKKITNWISIARNSRGGPLPNGMPGFKSANPDSVDWDAPSYLVIFFDSTDWEFFEGPFQSGPKNLSLHFSTDNRKERNSSFFDARTISLPTGENLLVVDNHHICARAPHRRRKHGDVPDEYKFDIYYKIKLDDGANPPNYLVMIIDPSSRNTGP